MAGRFIDVVSDSTGETAEKVVRAAMLQFPHSGVQIRLHTRVRTAEVARPILERAAHEGALVVFTVVAPELREFIHALSYELKIDAIDVIGALIGKLAEFLDRQPINMPSGMLPLSEEYYRRIEAVEFAVKSDDGKEPRNFKKADLVLVGVSRTSKTPLSTLLAQRGLKVANLPLVLGVSIPRELEESPQDRVVGLTIGLDQLCEIRQARLRQLGMPNETNYALREHVREELSYAQQLFSRYSWPIIDVTGRAIEETAVIILETLKERDERTKAAKAQIVLSAGGEPPAGCQGLTDTGDRGCRGLTDTGHPGLAGPPTPDTARVGAPPTPDTARVGTPPTPDTERIRVRDGAQRSRGVR